MESRPLTSLRACPEPAEGAGFLAKNAKERGTHRVDDVSKIRSLGHPPYDRNAIDAAYAQLPALLAQLSATQNPIPIIIPQ